MLKRMMNNHELSVEGRQFGVITVNVVIISIFMSGRTAVGLGDF